MSFFIDCTKARCIIPVYQRYNNRKNIKNNSCNSHIAGNFIFRMSNNKEYTFGVFDGHGLQGHLVSEGIKKFFKELHICSIFF